MDQPEQKPDATKQDLLAELAINMKLDPPSPDKAVPVPEEGKEDLFEAARQLSIMANITPQKAMNRLVTYGILAGHLDPNTFPPKFTEEKDCLECGDPFRPQTGKPFCSSECFKKYKAKQ